MRVPIEIVLARREQLAMLLQQNRYLNVHELCERLKISEATARRDLTALEQANRITRTHGGALVDFNLRFPSFQQRQNQSADGKRALAEKAVAQVAPGMTLYLDAGTTVFVFAQLLMKQKLQPLTVVTASLPVADLLAGGEGIKVILTGGEFLRRQSVLVGKTAQRALASFEYDLAVLGVEGADREGLWNTQADVVKAQQIVLHHAKRTLVCADKIKLGKTAPVFLTAWSDGLELISDISAERAKAMLK